MIDFIHPDFWALVLIGPDADDCWLWLGSISSKGYPRFGRREYAHRLIYRWVVGEIPSEMTIDHLCFIRCCVNPWHLEAVTNKENILRGTSPSAIYARRNHCLHGHEFTEANTVRFPGRSGRVCRICSNERSKQAHRLSRGTSSVLDVGNEEHSVARTALS